jgi:hypothetical protein
MFVKILLLKLLGNIEQILCTTNFITDKCYNIKLSKVFLFPGLLNTTELNAVKESNKLPKTVIGFRIKYNILTV